MRRTGQTTRLVDQFIQELYQNGKTRVYDHMNDNEEARENIYNRVLKRLSMEHPHDLAKIKKDDRTFEISFK